MSKAGYTIQTGAAVALVATTAKTILFVTAPSSFGVDLKKIKIGFDGVSASAVPVVVELCANTAATNSTPGTNNTAATVNQIYGRAITAGFVGGYNCTAEPTVLTPVDHFLLSPNGGLVLYDWPLGDSPDSPVSNGFAIRCTAPANVNVRASLAFERC